MRFRQRRIDPANHETRMQERSGGAAAKIQLIRERGFIGSQSDFGREFAEEPVPKRDFVYAFSITMGDP